jgi:hypothetical protein
MNTNSTYFYLQEDIILILENLPEVKNWKWKEESKTKVTISFTESKWIELKLTDTTLSIESGATVYPRRRIDTIIDVTGLTCEQIASNLRKILADHNWLEGVMEQQESTVESKDATETVVSEALPTPAEIIPIIQLLPSLKDWDWSEEAKNRVLISAPHGGWGYVTLTLTSEKLFIRSGAASSPRRYINTDIKIDGLGYHQTAHNLYNVLKDHGWLEDPIKKEEAIASDFDFTDLVVQLRLHTRINWQIAALKHNIATLSPSSSLGDWWDVQVVLFPSSLRLMNAEYYHAEVPMLDHRIHFEGSNPEGVAACEISRILRDKWIDGYFSALKSALKEAEKKTSIDKSRSGLKAIADTLEVKLPNPDKLAIQADTQPWKLSLIWINSELFRFQKKDTDLLAGKFHAQLIPTTPEETLEFIEWAKSKGWIEDAIALS